MNKKAVPIICITLLVVAVLVVGLTVRSRQTAQETVGAITLKFNGETRQVPLTDLDRTAFSGETVNGKGDRVSHDYRGILLRELLEVQKIDLSAVSTVRAVSADQFSANYTIDEIRQTDNIYLAVQIDGKPAPGIESGTSGAQMVAFGDPDSKRNVRGLSIIEAEL